MQNRSSVLRQLSSKIEGLEHSFPCPACHNVHDIYLIIQHGDDSLYGRQTSHHHGEIGRDAYVVSPQCIKKIVHNL